ncbi:hypothetical protein QRO08_16025 [Paracidovorax citrulli]|nr:hypothetical protein [Paracidovorax citrulli]ATG94661.1 hypothetical protein CQB05_12005 [Paracidovorax citrulli]PVY66529.1 hypothetical protein C8E08_3938 [Paracidovorax citrulli]REG69301.1 hypothetical protein C8E07_2448 [Paracidovorax citrulli]RLJ93856.1 hypothetical protein C8E06_2448 [Paracidovorax citrulli]UMT84009.1 hypothetical protein FRC75_11875 [Paracidovorax citrulli]
MDTNNTAARGAASQPDALRLADALAEQAEVHQANARDWDMRPEDTANWRYYETCRDAAAQLRSLHALTTAAPAAQEAEPALDDSEVDDLARGAFETAMSYGVDFDAFRRLAMEVRRRCAAALPQADAGATAIASDISADLERSDWTAEEALRWYAAGKHYDTVPNGDGTSSARILDNGAVASNALKSLSREYAEHKGDVALQEVAAAPQAPAAATAAALEKAWRAGWAACRDAEYVGEAAEDEAWGASATNGLAVDIEQQAPAAGAAPSDADTVDLVGVRASGEHVNLGKMPMPPSMKARDIATSQFGGFQDGDGSDAELCFGAMEELLSWLTKQGWGAAAPAQEAAPLSYSELLEIRRAMDDFEDCGETDVDYRLLLRAALAGYLECMRFRPLNQSLLDLETAIEAARARKEGGS